MQSVFHYYLLEEFKVVENHVHIMRLIPLKVKFLFLHRNLRNFPYLGVCSNLTCVSFPSFYWILPRTKGVVFLCSGEFSSKIFLIFFPFFFSLFILKTQCISWHLLPGCLVYNFIVTFPFWEALLMMPSQLWIYSSTILLS